MFNSNFPKTDVLWIVQLAWNNEQKVFKMHLNNKDKKSNYPTQKTVLVICINGWYGFILYSPINKLKLTVRMASSEPFYVYLNVKSYKHFKIKTTVHN